MPLPLNLGGISLAIQVVILFLLILGVPFVKGVGGKKNYLVHGYVTVLAVIMHTIVIFYVMVPTFSSDLGLFSGFSFVNLIISFSHIIFGAAAEVLGVIIVGHWLAKSPSKLACFKMRRLMLPLFIVWTLSVVTGAIVYFFSVM